MAAQRLRCKKCRSQFSRPLGSRRIYCESCSPPKVRSVPSAPAEIAPDRQLGELESRALTQLAAAGREKTLEGGLVLKLARDLDQGGHSGSQTAALAARLMDATRVALAGAAPKADGLDELEERRRRKAAGA